MFKKKPANYETTLQELIDATQTKLEANVDNIDEYNLLLTRLERLYALNPLKEEKKKLSPDSILATAGSLVGILAILNFERAGVVTSKAMSFVTKSKN